MFPGCRSLSLYDLRRSLSLGRAICILGSLKAQFSKLVDFSPPVVSAKPLKDPDEGVHLVGITCSLKASLVHFELS